jgi:hypothetical protein
MELIEQVLSLIYSKIFVIAIHAILCLFFKEKLEICINYEKSVHISFFDTSVLSRFKSFNLGCLILRSNNGQQI